MQIRTGLIRHLSCHAPPLQPDKSMIRMAIQREQQYAVLARGIREMIRELRVDEALKAIESDRSIIKWAEAKEWTFAFDGVRIGDLNFVRKLFELGADPNATVPDAFGNRLPLITAAITEGNGAMYNLIVEKGGSPESKIPCTVRGFQDYETTEVTHLEMAININSVGVVNAVLSAGSYTNIELSEAVELAKHLGYAECQEAVEQFMRVRGIPFVEILREDVVVFTSVETGGRTRRITLDIDVLSNAFRDPRNEKIDEAMINTSSEILRRLGETVRVAKSVRDVAEVLIGMLEAKVAEPEAFISEFEKLGALLAPFEDDDIVSTYKMISNLIEAHSIDLFGINANRQISDSALQLLYQISSDSSNALLELRQNRLTISNLEVVALERKFGFED